VSIEWSKQLKERALALTIHESKTDQEAKGKTLAVGAREVRELCALRAVEDWLAATDDQQKEDSPRDGPGNITDAFHRHDTGPPVQRAAGPAATNTRPASRLRHYQFIHMFRE